MFSYYLKIIALLSITVAIYSAARQLGAKSPQLSTSAMMFGLFGSAVYSMSSLTAIALAVGLVGIEFARVFNDKKAKSEMRDLTR